MLQRHRQPIGPSAAAGQRPLRICLLSYRSNPHSGGQGVYVKNLSRALSRLGHAVDVVSGPPDLALEPGIAIHRLDGLDLYNPADPFRLPSLIELSHPLNFLEWIGVSTMGFPEPFVFGIRAYRYLKRHGHRYDIVHDNQSLSYGVWAAARRLPTVATIHHPISIDRTIAVRSARHGWEKMKQLRWYSFVGMQIRVARTLSSIITVSRRAGEDISRSFGIPLQRCRIVANGIDIDRFRPMPGVVRDPHRLIVTNSADIPLKGLAYLLQAVAVVARRRPIRLVVVGEPRRNGVVEKLVAELGIGGRVTFTGRITGDAFVRHYAVAAAAVVPSLYEGFGLPAGEAMACAVPVISTTAGALPEVVGNAGLLVPPADSAALTTAIDYLLDHPRQAAELGWKGHERVQRLFTWERAARLTADTYREAIGAHR
jgi:glycosyltransferase involved in cell wall biosynthesis